MLRTLLNDEAGFIVSAELVLVATILVIGMIVGLSEVQHAVVQELGDLLVSQAGSDKLIQLLSLLLGHGPQHFQRTDPGQVVRSLLSHFGDHVFERVLLSQGCDSPHFEGRNQDVMFVVLNHDFQEIRIALVDLLQSPSFMTPFLPLPTKALE